MITIQKLKVPEVTNALLSCKFNETDIIPIPKIEQLRNELEAEMLQGNNSLLELCQEKAKNIEDIIKQFTLDNQHALTGKFSLSLLSNQFKSTTDTNKKHITILLKQIEILLKTVIDAETISKEVKNNILAQIVGYTDFACIEGSMERLEKMVQAISTCKVSGVATTLYKIKESWLSEYCGKLTDPSSILNKKQNTLINDLNIHISSEMHVHNVNTLLNGLSNSFGLQAVTKTHYVKDLNENQKSSLISFVKEEFSEVFISILVDNIESTITDLLRTLNASGDFQDDEKGTAKQRIEWEVCKKLPDILEAYGINYSANDIDQVRKTIEEDNSKKLKAENLEAKIGQAQEKLKLFNAKHNGLILPYDEAIMLESLATDLPLALRAVIASSPLMEKYITDTKFEIPAVPGLNNEQYLGYNILNTGNEIIIHIHNAIYSIYNELEILTKRVDIYENTLIGADFIKAFNKIKNSTDILEFAKNSVFNLQIKSDYTEDQIKQFISTQQEKYSSDLVSYFKSNSYYIAKLQETQIKQLLNLFHIKQYERNSMLLSENSFNLYKSGIEPDTLNKIEDTLILKSLTSNDARYCYEDGYCTFKDLKYLDAKKITALTRGLTRECYKKNYCKFYDLKDLDASKIEFITSGYALHCYSKGHTFNTMHELYNHYMMDKLYYEEFTRTDEKEYIKFSVLQEYLQCCSHEEKEDLTNPSVVIKIANNTVKQNIKETVKKISEEIMKKVSNDDLRSFFTEEKNMHFLDIINKVENNNALHSVIRYVPEILLNKIIKETSSRISHILPFSKEEKESWLYRLNQDDMQLDIQDQIYNMMRNIMKLQKDNKITSNSGSYILYTTIIEDIIKEPRSIDKIRD